MKSPVGRISLWLVGVIAATAIAIVSHALVVYLLAPGYGSPSRYIQVHTGSGTVDFLCGFASQPKAGQQTELKCSVQPRTEGAPQQPKYPLGISISIGGSTDFDIPSGFASLLFTSSEPKSVAFRITPRQSGSATLFVSTNVNGDQNNANWPLDIATGSSELAWTAVTAIAALATLFIATMDVRMFFRQRADLEELTERKISEAETKAEQAPEKARFAWDLARVKLEAYFNRNLSQVNQVFLLAASVMVVGFGFVVFGVVVSLLQPKLTPPALIAGISGIITQFIGATFLVIYRSTMAQANEFMAVLERINTVGMAIQVLDSIPESQLELKNSTRTEIVKLLLSANIRARTTKKSSKRST